MIGNSVANASTGSMTDFGVSPRNSALFNKHLKVVKCHRINISAGGNYKHVFKINYNKVLTRSRFLREYVAPYTH